MLKQEDPELNIDLELNAPPESILLDEVHMSTAVNNLLSNAVKYGITPCKIKVDVAANNGFLILSLSDNGPGIRREELKHIFEEFYRGGSPKRGLSKDWGWAFIT